MSPPPRNSRSCVTVLLLLCAVAASAQTITPTPDAAVTPTRPLVEDVSLRTAQQKWFRGPDGAVSVHAYSHPIHYRDEAGVWRDMDTTMAADGDGWVANQLPFAVRVSKFGTSHWWVAIGDRTEGWAHGFRLPGTPTVRGGTISYQAAGSVARTACGAWASSWNAPSRPAGGHGPTASCTPNAARHTISRWMQTGRSPRTASCGPRRL